MTVVTSERQGRRRIDDPRDLVFIDEGDQIAARLGVVTVGIIVINSGAAHHPFMWRSLLPFTPSLQPSRDVEAAKRALSFKTREWLDAAGLVVSAAARRRLEGRP